KSKKFRDYFKFKESPKLISYLSFNKSRELIDYEELEKLVTSSEFENKKRSLEDQKATEENKIKEFATLTKSKPVKNYFRFKESTKLKEFKTISKSDELEKFNELEKYISSEEFRNAKNTADQKEFKNTPEGKKEHDFEALKKSRNIKFYFKFDDSIKYKNYLAFEKSNELKKYNELQEYLNSSDHKEKLANAKKGLEELNGQLKNYQQKKKSSAIKTYYKFHNSQKFKDFQAFEKSNELADYIELEKYLASEEHKETLISIEEKEKAEADKKKKHEDFNNSKKYKWYLSVKDSNKFDELKNWKLVFGDDFSDGELNTDKWITRYLWGDKFINDAYALEVDKAFPTDGKNVELSGNSLKIVTRKEQTEGKTWKQPFGFIPQDFDYTTGLISTAKSHRQKYGKFEAKIKVNYAKPVNYNFWMVSEKNLPHVDILKLNKKKTKVELASYTGDITDNKGPDSVKSEYTGLDVAQDYFIYTFIWTPDKLTWKINEVIVNEQKKNIPQEEMYLIFSSSMTGKVDGVGLPASLEIDWVRCYKEV
ncbi:MAG: glycoside hydrolase family 16 protein, partial [Bacteroidales bacterium]|nr:glycoside hydrolase family 16 protein [Bacteroidales bacterium]